MFRSVSATRCLVSALIVGTTSLTAIAAPSSEAPKAVASDKPLVVAKVVADRSAIAPGDSFNLLVTLQIADDAHVYWHNPGGPGLPTRIEWFGPAGFRFGRTQFPAPAAKYDEALKSTSFILEGSPQFVTPVKAPTDLKPGTIAAFRAKVSWLSCKKGLCLPGGQTLSVEIPVAATAAPASEAILEEFDGAAYAVPSRAEKAEHLKFSIRTDKKTVKPGESFNAIITTQIAAKHHMQSNKPLEDYLIPALVFVEPVRDGEIGKITYPKSHIRDDPMLGKMSEYSGKVEFTIPITLEKTVGDKPIDNQPRWVRGVFQSQICSDSGTCFAPQYLAFAVPIQMEGGPAPANSPDEFVERVATAADLSDDDSGVVSVDDTPESASVADAKSWIGRTQDWLMSFGYVGVLLLAFIGGVVLNLMPCVLPVISLKILSYVKQSNEDRKRILALGLSYCAGLLTFFCVISVLYFTSGRAWGEHFQDPYVVLILAAVITAFALSLFGVFAVFAPTIVNKLGAKAEETEGLHSAFFTGVLATVLGTACTGPFMSVALGAARDYTELQGALIFLTVGVGMALPFLLLSMNPKWLKFVPKPGPWMGTFEAIMGFILLATVIWIVNPIRNQLGDFGLLLSLMFLLGVAIAVWFRGKAQFSTSTGKRVRFNLIAVAMLAIAWIIPFVGFKSVDELLAEAEAAEKYEALGRWYDRTGGEDILPEPKYEDGKIDWFRYKKDLVDRYVNAGYTVFIDFTADWCPTCKTNLSSSIDIESTRKLMKELRVIPFEADYTRKSAKMKKIIESYGRPSVPLYVVFSPNSPDDPQVLDEILTAGGVATALKKAGPSKPGTKMAAVTQTQDASTTPKPDAQ